MAKPSSWGGGAPGGRNAAAASAAAFPSHSSRAPGPTSGGAASLAGPCVLQFHAVAWNLPGGHALWARPLNVALGAGVTGLVGANGSGKSVFLQLAQRTLLPASGAIRGNPTLHAVAQEWALRPRPPWPISRAWRRCSGPWRGWKRGRACPMTWCLPTGGGIFPPAGGRHCTRWGWATCRRDARRCGSAAASACAWHWRGPSCRAPICWCWMSPPTTWTAPAGAG